ncbi:MAG: transcription termination/antitermination protein NusG [Myxococcota bacterium]
MTSEITTSAEENPGSDEERSALHSERSEQHEETEHSASVSESASSRFKWYVVQAYSGYESKVKISLEERIKQADLESRFGEILIPKENIQESRGGNRKVTSKNFYPGYIFVQIDLNEDTWHLIKNTPKVNGFIGGHKPTPVPDTEIQAISEQVAEGAAKPKPRVVFEQGDHIRVIDGAFANFTGSVEEVKPDKQKVKVLVSIFGRATPVELDYAQVEKTV